MTTESGFPSCVSLLALLLLHTMPRASPGDCVSPRVGRVLSGMKSSLYMVCLLVRYIGTAHWDSSERKGATRTMMTIFYMYTPLLPPARGNRREPRAAGAGRGAGRDAQRLAGPGREIQQQGELRTSPARGHPDGQIRSPSGPAQCPVSRIPIAASRLPTPVPAGPAPGGPGAPVWHSALQRGSSPRVRGAGVDGGGGVGDGQGQPGAGVWAALIPGGRGAGRGRGGKATKSLC